MIYVILGALGFVFLMLFDYSSMKNHITRKYVFGLLGIGLLTSNTLFIILEPTTISFSYVEKYSSLVLAIIFLALLIYSVFIEVGSNTYEKMAKPELITTGTYKLVRHPGVIWFFFTYLFASFYFENSLLFIAAIVWGLFNTIYTYFQEKLILVRIFDNYNDYIGTTPMFIPNITSFKKFMASENWRK